MLLCIIYLVDISERSWCGGGGGGWEGVGEGVNAEMWNMCILCRRIGASTEVSYNLDQIIVTLDELCLLVLFVLLFTRYADLSEQRDMISHFKTKHILKMV